VFTSRLPGSPVALLGPPAAAPPAGRWGTTHQAVAVAVADAIGIPVPEAWADGLRGPDAEAGLRGPNAETGLRGPNAETGGPPVDWPGFASLVAGHGVASLVRRSPWLAAQAVPNPVDGRLHVLARRGAAANLRNLAALSEIVAGAAGAGVDVLVLGGLPLSAWAFGDPLARVSRNLRLAVTPEEVPAAAGVLGRLGFEAIGPVDTLAADAPAGGAELTFVRGATFVDLQWRLFANAALLPLDLADPRSRLLVGLGGVRVTTLAREPAWWFLAVQGTQRRWATLRWVADAAAVLGACPDLASPAALDRAEAAGVDRCVATAMRLAADVLGWPPPAPARAWLAARPGSERLAHQSRRYLAATVPAGGRAVDAAGRRRAPVRLIERATFALGMRGDGRYRWAAVRLALAEGAHDHLLPLADRGREWPVPWRRLVARTARSRARLGL
jgi:hypothetical protein